MKKDGVSGDALKMLNAHLDGQLPSDEIKRLERRLRTDPALHNRLQELKQVKRLVQQAFADTSYGRHKKFAGRYRYSAIAAGLTLLLGVALGWGWNSGTLAPSATSAPGDAYVLMPADHPWEAPVSAGKVLLHIGSADLNRADAALRRTEELLAQYAQERRQTSFEIVVNSTGLELLRADTSPVGERIRQLQQRYGNLTFVLCRQTLERWRQERGSDPTLLPGVVVGPPALEHIIGRLQDGWAYLRI
jgi:intracellular sulfur oxidation DsrE/DsrF family protein